MRSTVEQSHAISAFRASARGGLAYARNLAREGRRRSC